MFLSRGDRELGVAFQTHLVSQALYRGEAKDSILLSSRDGYLLEPTKRPKGSQASCGVWKEDLGFLSRPCRKRRPSSHDDRGTAAAAAKSLQSCPTLCDPRDGSPPGSPIPGILQARTLEWAAISFSNA